ncbi:MAG: amidohydrolase family protein [Pirellulaceae bacterium]|nr:amidohydrolase family protein [Pirellulaceae bacterium]
MQYSLAKKPIKLATPDINSPSSRSSNRFLNSLRALAVGPSFMPFVRFCSFCLYATLGALTTFAQTADTIYHNGSILTMAGETPTYVEALAVRDGKIAIAGAKADVFKLKGDSTRVVDLEGKALLPGFIDGHSHYINSLLVANQCKLYAPPSGPGRDVPSIIAELKKYAADRKIPEGELIMGYGYDDTVMPDGRLLNRDDLDEAFPNHPVRIDHVSMHGAVMNSLALKKYGISAETKTPAGGIIVRKPGTEEPWGLIMETAFLPVFQQSEPMSAQQEIEWTRAGQLLFAEAGITTAQEGSTMIGPFETIQRATEAGANIIDVVAYPFITEVDKVLEVAPLSEWGKYRNGFKIGGVKITLDGSPQGRTAAFTSPYLTGGPGGEEDWRGELLFPQDLANKMVQKVYDMQVPLLIHCNGDAAIDAFLSAYELARAGDFSRPWNVTTIHTQFIRKDQIPNFVKYNIRPSFYTLHTFYFAEAHLANRGPVQATYISPMRDSIDAGLQPSNHTDFVVAPLDQMMMLWSAVNRVSRGGAVIGADQRVSPYEGLKSMTAWAAAQYDELDSKGTLEAGKRADLVILDKDPLQVDPLAIKDIKIVETIKDGTTIFPAPAELKTPKAADKYDGMFYRWRAHVCDRAEINQAAGKLWTLVKLNDREIKKENPPTLKFEKGQLSIFGGVNRLGGSYALIESNGSVVLGELFSTRMAGPPELMELEREFSQTMASVNGFHVEGNQLQLLSGSTVVADFRTSD